jgi:hypothetical protein
MFYSTSPTKIKEDLEKNCQCPCCDKFDFSRSDLGCSLGAAGDVLGDDFNADWACKVNHDRSLVKVQTFMIGIPIPLYQISNMYIQICILTFY